MKWLLLLLAGLAPMQAARAEIDRAALVRLGASVMRIEAARVQGGFALGSAVIVGDGLAVTNCHVTRDARAVQIVRGESRWTASAQIADVEHDLCLLQATGMPLPAVTLGRAADLRPGQDVVALGFTGGVLLQNSPGEVVALHRLDGAAVVQASNRFSSGASGGGLFDDAGRLVGILTFRLRGGEAHYFAAPAEWLQRLLDRGPGAFDAVQPLRTGERAYWELPLERQPAFLRAAVLRRDDRWAELIGLARAWLSADPANAEPWRLLGTALEKLNQPVAAREALECSLRCEPAGRPARHLPDRALGERADDDACRALPAS